MVARYIRDAELFQDNVAALVLGKGRGEPSK
jgi:hypothetical protein